jgi:RNA polymerase sigma factor (sigma-70 family)
MDDLGGHELKAAIFSESSCEEVWDQLVQLAEPLLQTIRSTFSLYTTAFDNNDCIEVLHNTYTQVILKIDQYNPVRPLLPWARIIARHLVIDVLRDRTQQWKIAEALSPSPVAGAQCVKENTYGEEGAAILSSDESESTNSAAVEPHLQYTYEYSEDSHLAGLPKTRIFQQELSQLLDEEQEFIIDHWGNGIPLVDLARRAGINDAAMRKRAERVRRKLYLRLIRYPEFEGLELSRVKKSLPGK